MDLMLEDSTARTQYIHFEVNAGSKDIIEVTYEKQANVRVMNYYNYQNYRRGRRYRYYGDIAKKSPVHITPPHQGYWYVVIDLGDNEGMVRASVKVLRGRL